MVLARVRRCTFLLAATALAACATQHGQVETATRNAPAIVSPGGPQGGAAAPGIIQPPQPPGGGPTPARPFSYPRTVQESGASSAVLALYRQAQEARAAGKPDQAGAFLERALRIDARNPFIWQSLAGVHLDLQQPEQAESAAQKSTSLGHGNPYVEAGNWRIIASARQARGDATGAMQAQARAEEVGRTVAPP
jgi:tetratricopeptide (TPR) repeat protein